jgi:hypothetical protein
MLFQGFENHLVGRSDSIIDFSEFPNRNASLINYIGRGMRDSNRSAGIQEPISVNYLVVFVLKKQEVERGVVAF